MHYTKTHINRLPALILVVLTLPSDVRAIVPSFTGIGDLPGNGVASTAIGVSGNGLTVVGQGRSDSFDEAIRWDGGVISPLGQPGSRSAAIAASYDGSFIVGYDTDADFEGYWSNGALVDIGKLPGGCTSKDVYGVSGTGNIIVGESCSAQGHQAFRWQNGVMTGLGDLPGGTFDSFARGVSHDGSYIVGTSMSNQGLEAFRWSNGSMIGLGDLPGGNFSSTAWDVSVDGATVVGSSKSAAGPIEEAFRWHNGVMSPLGFLAGFGQRSVANAVSADGTTIVGRSGNDNLGVQVAFVWTPGTGMRNLKTILQTDYGLNLTGWTLKNAVDISYDGLTIVGSGINPAGQSEGWIVHLPESSSLSLLLMGIIGCRRVRRLAR